MNARYKRFNSLKEAEDFAYGTISSTPLPPQASNSDPRGRVAKGKKRAHAEIEDESCWDVVYCDGACKRNGQVDSVAGVGVWWGHEDPRSVSFALD
jgi:ribonuclease HI